jgi:hypothetical protein
VQLYKSEAAGGKRKVKDLLAEELTYYREHDDVQYSGVKLSLRFIATDSEAKLISDDVENLCGGRGITHLKSPPRSHRHNFIEGRMKTLVSRALSAYHYSGYPLTFFLHARSLTVQQLSTSPPPVLDQQKRIKPRRHSSADSVRYLTLPICTPSEQRYMYTRPKEERGARQAQRQGQGSILPTSASPHPHSHDLRDPNAMDIVQRADELFNVLHKITYGMEMGEQFEKRLLMHRNARKLDEGTNRQLLQL